MATTLGTHNPLRYRGYVYDDETGLYYLQSRYYDPELGRFLNADAFVSTGQGFISNNMFAYCGNNPVSRKDDGGEFWHVVIGAAVGAAVSFTASVVADIILGNEIDWASAGIAAAFGAASGALAATGLGPAIQIAGGALLSGAENVVEQGRESGFDNIDYVEVAINAVVGGVSSNANGLSKATANHLNRQGINATKRVAAEIKSNGIKATGNALKKAGAYYLSQTSTLFYKPLIKSSVDSLIDASRKYFLEATMLTVW